MHSDKRRYFWRGPLQHGTVDLILADFGSYVVVGDSLLHSRQLNRRRARIQFIIDAGKTLSNLKEGEPQWAHLSDGTPAQSKRMFTTMR
jgi:hypothetical protein